MYSDYLINFHFPPYIIIFSCNFLIEILTILIGNKPKQWPVWIGIVFLLNMVTHPLIWFCIPDLWDHYWLKLAIAEIFVLVTEVILGNVILQRYGFCTAIITKWIIIANFVSFCFTFIFPW